MRSLIVFQFAGFEEPGGGLNERRKDVHELFNLFEYGADVEDPSEEVSEPIKMDANYPGED